MSDAARARIGRETDDRRSPQLFDVEVLYDGDCPLCRREIEMIRNRDNANRIRFTNIADEDFDPSSVAKTHDELMAEIHGRLADGTMISGVEVFRQLYSAIGFRRAAAVSRWPVIRHLLDFGYRIFARNRLKLTGRRCAVRHSREDTSLRPPDRTCMTNTKSRASHVQSDCERA